MSALDTPGSGEEDDAVLAAEHALGLLDGGERQAAERRLEGDAAFARLVEMWRARFAELAAEIAPQAAPARVWTGIARSLGGGEVVELRLRRRLAVWRATAAAASGLAAALALALLWPRPVATPAAVMTARLSATASGPAVFVAFYDPQRRSIVLTPASVEAGSHRSPELWLLPPGGKPVALGVATFGGSARLIEVAAPEGLAGGALAVSVEPLGGSPTGQPTGPVIATGQLSRL